jgi:hypothetical protein
MVVFSYFLPALLQASKLGAELAEYKSEAASIKNQVPASGCSWLVHEHVARASMKRMESSSLAHSS